MDASQSFWNPNIFATVFQNHYFIVKIIKSNKTKLKPKQFCFLTTHQLRLYSI